MDLLFRNDPFRLMSSFQQTNLDWNQFSAREELYLKRVMEHTECVDKDTHPKLFCYFRVVKNKTEVYDIVSKSFYRRTHWRELPHGLNLRSTWNLLWTWTKPQVDLKKLIIFQRINHFINNKHISRKDMLKKSLDRVRTKNAHANKLFDIQPPTFVLPKEYSQFVQAFMRERDLNGHKLWILKPAARSRGRGISLINDYSNLTFDQAMVVQKYVSNPLLLDGYKFDLRIYVLVTSIHPLEVFIYKEGFARVSTEPYCLDEDE